MRKIVYLGTGKSGKVFCEIKIIDGYLTIVGVEGPLKNGDSIGGWGQIVGHLADGASIKPAKGLTAAKIKIFLEIWRRWHLNEMRAGCKHQCLLPRTPSFMDICVVCGYAYGSSWHQEELPEAVFKYLDKLPTSRVSLSWL